MNEQNREFQAYIGHVLDIYKIANFNFNNPHSYTKFRQIKFWQRKTNASAFIETGTFKGVTTKRCSPIFSKVYTIELDEKLAEEAQSYLLSNTNVQVIQGDALEVLPKLLEFPEIDHALVFLDGHFSGGITACGDLPEPAIEELKILAKYKNKIKCIIIDDFRLFGTEVGFPKKSALLKAVEDYFNDYQVSIHLDQLILAQL